MPHEVVAALIVRAGKILLGQRAAERVFYPDVWDMFGGHVEPGEQLQQTLVRELEEELGITPTQWAFLETLTVDLPSPPEEPPDLLIVHIYRVTDWTGMPANMQPEEHSTIGWFTLEEAVQLPLADAMYPELFARYRPPPPSAPPPNTTAEDF
jgi:8-oxo-dGTP diphosphatase